MNVLLADEPNAFVPHATFATASCSTEIVSSAEQPVNALSPIFETLLGITSVLSDEQPSKALIPTLVTVFGISNRRNPVYANDNKPIFVTFFGNVTPTRF